MSTVEDSRAKNIAFQIPDKLLYSESMFDSILEALARFENASTVYFHIHFARDSLDKEKSIKSIIESFREDLLDEDSPIDREKIAMLNNASKQVKEDIKGCLFLTLNFEIIINRRLDSYEDIASDILAQLILKTKNFVNIH